MAMLRSRRIAFGKIGGTRNTEIAGRAAISDAIYTCPPGYRAIVRDWQLLLSDSVDPQLRVAIPFVVIDGGEALWITMWQSDRNNGGGISMQTDIVLEPGNILGLLTDATSIEYYVSGAELTIPV